ncbi:MAG: hypothetical protein ABSG92_08135 [Conexivisphaerales archaeon]|jgi:hypothetical protein
MNKQKELKKYRRYMVVTGLAAVVGTFGSLALFIALFPALVAYFGSSLVGLPFLLLLWRFESRYTDLLFRDDI